MKRTPANPSDWRAQFLMNQGEVVEGATRQLHCSGQVAVKPDPESEMGIAVVSAGDLGQMPRAGE